jgi:hypothetical protein
MTTGAFERFSAQNFGSRGTFDLGKPALAQVQLMRCGPKCACPSSRPGCGFKLELKDFAYLGEQRDQIACRVGPDRSGTQSSARYE